MTTDTVDTVVIGGGQAGLAVGYYLRRHERDFVILDAGQSVGETWRGRWDSLRLFTPRSFNGLPGLPFPSQGERYPSKDDMAGYLESYAARFELPVQLGAKVDELTRVGDQYRMTTGSRRLKANHVVVATGAYATPRVPAFAGRLDPAMMQFHSVAYRHPGQLPDGPVLVVGAGNSGAEIARELAAKHPTWLAGRDTGYIPGDPKSFGYQAGTILFQRVMKLLTVDTRPGRWLIGKAKETPGGHPLVRLRAADLLAAGVRRVPRVVGVSKGRPVLEDGSSLDVASVVWCTGFRRAFRWIRLPVFDSQGEPIHHRGVVKTEPGLYFTGLPFQSSLLSGLVAGAGADAQYVVQQIAARARASQTASQGVTRPRHATSPR